MTRLRTVDLAWAAITLSASAAVLVACTPTATTIDPAAGPARAVPSASAAVVTPPPTAPSAAPSTAPPSARVSAVAADRGAAGNRPALELLQSVAVKGRAPMTGYSREQFGQAWTDDNDDPLGHNGCDTRNDVLRRDLTAPVVRAGTYGCVVVSGTLTDPYTGRPLHFVRGVDTSSAVQIDHVVALGDAWQTGAQQLTAEARTDLANDPLELLAVDGPANEAKGDSDAASWLPPNKAYRCAYVARQIAVKARYGLWMTSAESAAAARVLTTCPSQAAPAEPRLPIALRAAPATPSAPRTTPRPVPPPTRTSTTSHPAPPPRQGCTTTSSGSCIRGGQLCPQASYGETGTDADGRHYVCKGDPDHPHWELP